MFNSAGSVSIDENSSMVVSGNSSAGSGLDLFSADDVTLDATVAVVGNVSIVAGTTSGGIDVNAKLDGSGAILLDAADEITIDADIDPTTVTLNANDDITVNASVVASELITISAGQDGSGGFSLLSAGSLTTTDAGSDIIVSTGLGSGDIVVGGTTNAVDQVVFTSSAGSINGAGLVSGDTVDLTAASGIGSTTGMELSVSNISVDTSSGDIEVDNVLGAAVSLNSMTTGSGAFELDQLGGGELT